MIRKKTLPGQMTLGFVHQTKPTSSASCRSAMPKQSKRVAKAKDAFLKAGQAGMTRHELANGLGIPPHSAPNITKALIQSGEIVETELTRKTQYGGIATVLVHRRHFRKSA